MQGDIVQFFHTPEMPKKFSSKSSLPLEVSTTNGIKYNAQVSCPIESVQWMTQSLTWKKRINFCQGPLEIAFGHNSEQAVAYKVQHSYICSI